ncbi:MAG: SRPBCC family protein [Nocardioidaceae bacterium]
MVAEQTASSLVVASAPGRVMKVIADFDNYPGWAKGVRSAKILSHHTDGRAREVEFVLDAAPIKDEYVLSYEWEGDERVAWSLVRATMLTSMQGSYTLASLGNSTEVTYQLAVEVSIPMIGLLKRKAEKVVIDTALRGLKRRVETGG